MWWQVLEPKLERIKSAFLKGIRLGMGKLRQENIHFIVSLYTSVISYYFVYNIKSLNFSNLYLRKTHLQMEYLLCIYSEPTGLHCLSFLI